ncbi:MoxR family ATPase [Myxococcota bacterium]|nr:MoxR family ATPase [Myxococcota bacterium]
MPPSLDDLAGRIQALRATLAQAVIGQQAAVDEVLAALLAQGHVLLEGVPGLAKTLLARSLAQALGLSFTRIQFTPDLMPADIVGTSIFDFQRGEFRVQRGPVFTQVLLADEINRTPPKTQAALLEAMEERQVTIDGTTHPLAPPFFVLATQNPLDHEGTYPLPEAQLDRFLARVVLGYPEPADEIEVYRRYLDGRLGLTAQAVRVEPVFAEGELAAFQALLRQVHVEDKVLRWVRELVGATRQAPRLLAGASPRAGLALLAAGRAWAAMEGRAFVIPDDIKRLAAPVLAHRLVLSPDAELEGHGAAEVLAELLDGLPVPR